MLWNTPVQVQDEHTKILSWASYFLQYLPESLDRVEKGQNYGADLLEITRHKLKNSLKTYKKH